MEVYMLKVKMKTGEELIGMIDGEQYNDTLWLTTGPNSKVDLKRDNIERLERLRPDAKRIFFLM
ncbi:hypothetical protein [Paenibacillus sp. 1P07SE]|uniref:hypothetical protein n=1 Tax=Paenibacillus sp. 1P07SE TaxID=3132209 RepID=UPI0039A4815F